MSKQYQKQKDKWYKQGFKDGVKHFIDRVEEGRKELENDNN